MASMQIEEKVEQQVKNMKWALTLQGHLLPHSEIAGVWPRLKLCPECMSLYAIVDLTGERANEVESLIASEKAVVVPSEVEDVIGHLWLCEAMIEEEWFQKALCITDF